ncbi:MAG TPA: alpha/beta fold hydrolase [Myxococcaceae bacterium]|nr:alpha/beta fold hydrolase [Myxococcaceae bacterium]
MRNGCPPVVFLPGAGGQAPDLSFLRDGPSDVTRFITINYPGWRQYVEADFSPEVLIQYLVEQIIAAVASGPVALLGVSLGGHFCYALALRLRALGRDVAGICVIDSFMVTSSAAGKGWIGRAVDDAFYLLRKGRFREFGRHVLAKCWRALMRLAGPRLAGWMRGLRGARARPGHARSDSLFEFELSMRLLLRATAPWVASLDREPIPLDAPAALLRTPLTSSDDEAWRRRCPQIEILEIPGGHQTLFEAENLDALRAAFVAARRGWH